MTTASKLKSKSSAKGAKQSSSAGLWLVVGAVALLAIVVVVLVLNQRSGAITVSAPDVPAEWIEGTTLGSPDAPVTVQLWEDFLCPACQQWTAQVKPQLMADVQAGTVRLEFHQFPLQQHNPGALMAANATECAADQNQFWPYHDRVFQAATTRGQAGTTFEELVSYARELGLDDNALRSCMNNLTHNSAVAASLTQAGQLGLSSTPSVLVNGRLMENPFNYNALKAAIEAAAAGG